MDGRCQVVNLLRKLPSTNKCFEFSRILCFVSISTDPENLLTLKITVEDHKQKFDLPICFNFLPICHTPGHTTVRIVAFLPDSIKVFSWGCTG